jgi:hypothetical protein
LTRHGTCRASAWIVLIHLTIAIIVQTVADIARGRGDALAGECSAYTVLSALRANALFARGTRCAALGIPIINQTITIVVNAVTDLQETRLDLVDAAAPKARCTACQGALFARRSGLCSCGATIAIDGTPDGSAVTAIINETITIVVDAVVADLGSLGLKGLLTNHLVIFASITTVSTRPPLTYHIAKAVFLREIFIHCSITIIITTITGLIRRQRLADTRPPTTATLTQTRPIATLADSPCWRIARVTSLCCIGLAFACRIGLIDLTVAGVINAIIATLLRLRLLKLCTNQIAIGTGSKDPLCADPLFSSNRTRQAFLREDLINTTIAIVIATVADLIGGLCFGFADLATIDAALFAFVTSGRGDPRIAHTERQAVIDLTIAIVISTVTALARKRQD